jgi:aspartyl-tRNA(Asn)/glutamyl-tRNA(Gln) amidotransferase subunit A
VEAYALHRERLGSQKERFDRRVAMRILIGREQSAADYLDLIRAREDMQRRVDSQLAEFEAVLLPTAPIIAPLMESLETDEAYVRINGQSLRNTAVANFLDRCAISIPCQQPGTAPVGLMLMGPHDGDRRLLEVAAAAEALVSPGGS